MPAAADLASGTAIAAVPAREINRNLQAPAKGPAAKSANRACVPSPPSHGRGRAISNDLQGLTMPAVADFASGTAIAAVPAREINRDLQALAKRDRARAK
jgi:hypothetical protein